LEAKRPLIHIVDDDVSVGRSLGRLLRSHGLRTLEFSSGGELLAQERAEEADCSIVDVHMPGMSGYELATELKGSASQSRIIFISARAEELERWRSSAPTATTLLLKPFSEAELLTALEKALGPGLFERTPTTKS
jgi:FixJ family two-component response regulator